MSKMSFEEVTEKIRGSLLTEFDELKTLRDSGNLTDNDLEFFLARDRKSAIVLKTLDMDLRQEAVKLKYGAAPKRLK